MRLVLVQPTLALEPAGRNVDAILAAVAHLGAALGTDDLLLLPEHWSLATDAEAYLADVRTIARAAGCHVLGGSHHETRADGVVNTGTACAPDGTVVGRWEKLRPYADERQRVRTGRGLGELTIGGRRILVLVCADFWFSDLIQRATHAPDLVLVPALSVTRKPTPDYSRSLWRHLAIARAYEFGVYVGVSDWAAASTLPALGTAGVAGFADPTTTDPGALFRPVTGSATIYPLDFAALDAFRTDRRTRGFFWKP